MCFVGFLWLIYDFFFHFSNSFVFLIVQKPVGGVSVFPLGKKDGKKEKTPEKDGKGKDEKAKGDPAATTNGNGNFCLLTFEISSITIWLKSLAGTDTDGINDTSLNTSDDKEKTPPRRVSYYESFMLFLWLLYYNIVINNLLVKSCAT